MLILGSASETLGNAFSLQALSIISNPEATVSAFLMLFLKRHRRDYGLLFKINMFCAQAHVAVTRLTGTYLLGRNQNQVSMTALWLFWPVLLNSDIPFLSDSDICFFFSHFNISGIGTYLLINGLS